MMFDRTKFSFRELTMNYNGKQSGSAFTGVILGLIGAISFIAAIIGYFFQIPNTLEVMGYILQLIFAAALLLGVRKVSGDINSKNIAEANVTESKIEPTIEEKG